MRGLERDLVMDLESDLVKSVVRGMVSLSGTSAGATNHIVLSDIKLAEAIAGWANLSVGDGAIALRRAQPL